MTRDTPTALPAVAGPPALRAESNQPQPPPQHPTRSARTAPRLQWCLAIALAAALTATSCEWPPGLSDNPVAVAALGGGSIQGRSPNVVPDDDDDDGGGGVLVDRVYVEARARLAAGGAVEVGARVNATGLWWQPEERLFDYEAAPVGEWWTSSPIGPAAEGVSTVRIKARRLHDGNLELALHTPGGTKVAPRQPELAHAELTTEDWTYTSPVVLHADGEPAPPPPTENVTHSGFTAISTAESAGCGLRADGTVDCWGSPPRRESMSLTLEGTFVAVSTPCALRPYGDIACARMVEGSPERLGPFVALSDNPGCGIRPDGRIDCWRNVSALAGFDRVSFPPPAGAFSAVSVSYAHGCGIHLDGTVACWGDNEVLLSFGDEIGESDRFSGQARPPVGRFVAVSAAAQHSCGIRPDRTVECWGGNDFGQSTPPAGTFTAIRSGGRRFEGHTCGLRSDGRAECWGGRWKGYPEQFVQAPPPAPSGAFTALSGRGEEMCGLRADGGVDCWWPVDNDDSDVARAVRVHVGLSADFPDRLVEAEFTSDITFVPGGSFDALTVGGRHACGLRAGGAVACWGLDWHGQTAPPGGRFDALSVGGYHSCGLRADGAVECWGNNTHGQTTAPLGRFAALSAGWQHTCAVAADGAVSCSGDDTHGQTAAPAGEFTTVSAGGRHTCGLRTSGEVACWGDTTRGQTTAPRGSFDALTAGALHTCALAADGTVECWGDDRAGQSNSPDGVFSLIGAGADYTCGLRPGGNIDCWGADDYEFPPATPPPPGPFISLAVGPQIACGLRTDGTAECWAATGQRRIDSPPSRTTTRVPPGTYRALSAGAYHTCALNSSGHITCWGENSHAQATPPPGTHQHIASGDRHSCAINIAGKITCWGENTFGQTAAPPGQYRTLAAGAYHTCALNTAGTITCWGDNTHHQTTSPAGTYIALAAGDHHTCALDTEGTITCWGDNTLEQATPPTGAYTALAAGRLHTCALNTSGGVDCWGFGYDHDNTNPLDPDTPSTPPPGPFTAVAAGARHTCSINTTGDIECWPHQGRNSKRYNLLCCHFDYWKTWEDSRATPLPGPFTAVSAGTYHTCGIRPDGTIACWSANEPRTQ